MDEEKKEIINEASSKLADIFVDLIDSKDKEMNKKSDKEDLKDKLNKMKKEAIDAEEKGSYFEASILYKKLLGEANKQNNSEVIIEAKGKMIEMNKLSKNEFKEIEVKQEISNERIDEGIKRIIGDSNNLEEILYRIGHHPYLYPNKKQIENSTVLPLTSIIASNHLISTDNHALGGNDQKYIWYLENYGMNQGMIIQIYMVRIFKKLEEEYDMNFESLKSYIEKKKVFSPEDFTFIEDGLRLFFDGNYCASMHILVPRFERCFVELSKSLGINIISLKRPKKGTDDVVTSDITLSVELLRKEEFINVWSEDFCENIIYVFYERLGYGLRHKIAHGTIAMSECNKTTCELVIYFYLVLVARVKFIDEK